MVAVSSSIELVLEMGRTFPKSTGRAVRIELFLSADTGEGNALADGRICRRDLGVGSKTGLKYPAFLISSFARLFTRQHVNVYTLALGIGLFGLTTGCSGAGETRPEGMRLAGLGGAGTVSAEPCTAMERRECIHHFKQANGQATCFAGTEVCADGQWSPCLPDEQVENWLLSAPVLEENAE